MTDRYTKPTWEVGEYFFDHYRILSIVTHTYRWSVYYKWESGAEVREAPHYRMMKLCPLDLWMLTGKEVAEDKCLFVTEG